MFVRIIFLSVFLLHVTLTMAGTPEEEWAKFKKDFDRSYPTPEEETFRKGLFLDNLKFVEDHNNKYDQGQTTFTVGINQFSDYTPVEKPHGYGKGPRPQCLTKGGKNTGPPCTLDELKAAGFA